MNCGHCWLCLRCRHLWVGVLYMYVPSARWSRSLIRVKFLCNSWGKVSMPAGGIEPTINNTWLQYCTIHVGALIMNPLWFCRKIPNLKLIPLMDLCYNIATYWICVINYVKCMLHSFWLPCTSSNMYLLVNQNGGHVQQCCDVVGMMSFFIAFISSRCWRRFTKDPW